MPTPTGAPKVVRLVFATGSPADGRGHFTAVGSSDGSRDHVTATIVAE
jgi:hypothetical protein